MPWNIQSKGEWNIGLKVKILLCTYVLILHESQVSSDPISEQSHQGSASGAPPTAHSMGHLALHNPGKGGVVCQTSGSYHREAERDGGGG